MQQFRETGDTRYIYQNELDKACFQHDMAYWDFKDFPRETVWYKVLRDKVFNIAKNPKYDRYQRDLASMVYKFFDKKTFDTNKGTRSNSKNKELTEELHKSIIRKFEKRKVYLSSIDNILGADIADMQLINKFNEEFQFLLCVIDIHSKYAWVVSLNDKKGITITNAFQKILDE